LLRVLRASSVLPVVKSFATEDTKKAQRAQGVPVLLSELTGDFSLHGFSHFPLKTGSFGWKRFGMAIEPESAGLCDLRD